MGLPECISTALNEFIIGANCGLSLSLVLTRGRRTSSNPSATTSSRRHTARRCTRSLGRDDVPDRTAGRLDLGDIQTKAVKQPDGSYHIEGQKIFISWGDHDITPNIIHAVLARTPEAPVGAKGLSLFVVPKMLVNPDGSVGADNNMTTAGIEHKMGIPALPRALFSSGKGAHERLDTRQGEDGPSIHVPDDERGQVRGRPAGTGDRVDIARERPPLHEGEETGTPLRQQGPAPPADLPGEPPGDKEDPCGTEIHARSHDGASVLHCLVHRHGGRFAGRRKEFLPGHG